MSGLGRALTHDEVTEVACLVVDDLLLQSELSVGQAVSVLVRAVAMMVTMGETSQETRQKLHELLTAELAAGDHVREQLARCAANGAN